MWLINSHNWIKAKWIEPIDIDDYPAIKNHLNQYRERIEKRDDKWVTPYNLRNCAYTEDFYKPKIIYQELTQWSCFAYDENWDFMVSNTAYLITGENLVYLLNLLNSKIIESTFKLFYATQLWWKWIRWLSQCIMELPLPKYDNSDLKNKIMENQDCEAYIKDLFWLTDEEMVYLIG